MTSGIVIPFACNVLRVVLVALDVVVMTFITRYKRKQNMLVNKYNMVFRLLLDNIPESAYNLCLTTAANPSYPKGCAGATDLGTVPNFGSLLLTKAGVYQFVDNMTGIGEVSFLLLEGPVVNQQISYNDKFILNAGPTIMYVYTYNGQRIGELPLNASQPPTEPNLYYVLTADTFAISNVVSCFTIATNNTLNSNFTVAPNTSINTILDIYGTGTIIPQPVPTTFQNRTCTTLSLIAAGQDTASLYAQFGPGSRCSDLLLVLQEGSYFIGGTTMTQEQYGEINVADGAVTIITQPSGSKLVLLPNNVLKIVPTALCTT
jgi:hypothetical protein